jgi:head-tail adaptor
VILNGKPFNPGELRTKITFESRSVTQNVGAADQAGYTVLGEVLAKWVNVHGQEARASDAMQAKRQATVTARWRGDVDESCSIVLGWVSEMSADQQRAARYEITSLDNIQERGEYIEFQVSQYRGA